MGVYGEGALSAYGLTNPKSAHHREQDAHGFSAGIYWIIFVYFGDRGLVWA